jgi:glutaconate CoA-transferase subunit B
VTAGAPEPDGVSAASAPSAAPASAAEVMVVALARLLADREQVVNGAASFVPVAAILLARETHAPDLVWLASAVGLDARPRRLPDSTLEAPLWHRAAMHMPQLEDFWSYATNGRWLGTFCVRGAQIDRFGNANNSVIGDDPRRPRVRLPGSAGLGDMGSLGKRLLFWTTTHDRRTLVERVDFVTCAGWLGGGEERRRKGLTGGPEAVVTNLCTMDFEPRSKAMRLVSLHPGVGLDQVRDATGFELLLPAGEIPTTPAPTAAELALIREKIDPDRVIDKQFPG